MPKEFEEYKGEDIKLFDDKENWYPWQKEIYSKIFYENNSFKKSDERKIISIIDKTGNCGKLSFFKWLFYNHVKDIGKIGYGTASQLRASITNIGVKKLYIVDLSRAKGREDREEDLLAVLNETKSGFVTNAMYGSGITLMMNPPHIIVSSNYEMKYELLSEDRWEFFEILESKKLKQLSIKKRKK